MWLFWIGIALNLFSAAINFPDWLNTKKTVFLVIVAANVANMIVLVLVEAGVW